MSDKSKTKDTFTYQSMDSRVPEELPLKPHLVQEFKEKMRGPKEHLEINRQRDAANFVIPKALDKHGN